MGDVQSSKTYGGGGGRENEIFNVIGADAARVSS